MAKYQKVLSKCQLVSLMHLNKKVYVHLFEDGTKLKILSEMLPLFKETFNLVLLDLIFFSAEFSLKCSNWVDLRLVKVAPNAFKIVTR